MATLRKLFRLRDSPSPTPSSSSGSSKGSIFASHKSAAATGATTKAICEGLVHVRTVSRGSAWKWLWLELRPNDDGSANLASFEPGHKGSGEHYLESLRIEHVERVSDKQCCLILQFADRKRHSDLYLRFSTESDLYTWQEEIYSRCPSTGIVDHASFTHNMHVQLDEHRGSLAGFPNSLTEYFEASLKGDASSSRASSSSVNLGSRSAFWGQSSVEIPTPATSFPASDADEDDDLEMKIPRVHISTDHIGYTPRSPVESSTPNPNFLHTDIHIGTQPAPSSWPNVQDLTNDIERLGIYPVASGGFSDIFQGRLHRRGSVRIVGIKVIRAIMSSRKGLEQRLIKRLNSEIDVWQRLHHENVVELLGVCRSFGQHPALVSWWYDNGHVMDYLEGLGDEATLSLRLKLLLDVAKGLQYLHSFSSPVLHGDLKGANVLVSKSGVGMLTDFGLSSIFEDIVGSRCLSGSGGLGCSVRWMAVELVCSMGAEGNLRNTRFTPASDVYSFGSTMLEVLTGKVPYPHCPRDVQVIMEIFEGGRHQRRGTEIPSHIWDFMELLWSDIPDHRPRCSHIVRELGLFYGHELELIQQSTM